MKTNKFRSIYYDLFDEIGLFLKSHAVVMLGMFLLFAFMVLETQTLFERIFPPDMGWKILPGSIFIALLFEGAVLITTANEDKLSDSNTEAINVHVWLLAASHFIVNLFFWDVFFLTAKYEPGYDHYILIGFRVFASALISYLNVLFSILVVNAWDQRVNENEQIATSERLQSEVERLQSEYERLTSDSERIESDIEKSQSDHERNIEHFNEIYSDLQEKQSDLELKVKQAQQKLEEGNCPYCGYMPKSKQQLSAHLAHCQERKAAIAESRKEVA